MSGPSKRQKTVITAETFERMTVRLRRKKTIGWCKECAAEVLMLAPNEAAAIARTTARAIFRRVEAGELHFLETENGELLLCRNSLRVFH